MTEKVSAFGWREAWDEIAERFPECADGSQRLGAEQCFEFGESLFDRVEVGTVGRQIEQTCAGTLDRLANAGDLVRAEPVHDHDIAAAQRGSQHLLDIGEEGLAVDRPIEHARSNQAGAAQTGDEGRGIPVPVRHSINQPMTHLCPAVKPGHIGLGPGLVDEDQFGRIKRPLALPPFCTSCDDVRPILLTRPERLFFSVSPSSLNVYQINPTLAET